ncbi:CoA-substrate-specific enzyme activase, putative [Peptoclostridium litorale DSM 5388]|uniref:R-phenyllactate dehydratase activator n=1 Tax=Peptoclostridium litorale DSM 5388 TaxID=1121324 RepID=A0A069RB25_PEPLI|nr:acyl-CoA dehydratase activase [Peptoclostridium litorale]KDR94231.1 R-phenyllactate dehydratase activator [Peptoclostridium litorale DSM 5388]SIN82650.1 CoA-substrate-specific enzyme activase, putative [Peptoclostridium litorale DSM 5388]
MSDQYTMGIDIGSTASKCIILKNGSYVEGSAVISVGAGTSGPKRAVAEALEKANKSMEEITAVVATGYGRNTFTHADKQMSELSCHAKGAHFIFPDVKTIIDIGGQDAKALKISPSGKLMNFVMNDKCAAGTGRFLDVMTHVLEVDISDLAKTGEQSQNPVDISSTCTVFAESEVISHLSNRVAISDIVAGIHNSVASRVAGLAKRVGVASQVVMTGGVAQNAGVVKALERELDVSIETTPMAQLVGALGAALYAYELLEDKNKSA